MRQNLGARDAGSGRWRATFFPVGIAHSIVVSTAWEPRPWRAVQRAVRGAGRREQSVTPSGRGRLVEDHTPLSRHVGATWAIDDDDLVHAVSASTALVDRDRAQPVSPGLSTLASRSQRLAPRRGVGDRLCQHPLARNRHASEVPTIHPDARLADSPLRARTPMRRSTARERGTCRGPGCPRPWRTESRTPSGPS